MKQTMANKVGKVLLMMIVLMLLLGAIIQAQEGDQVTPLTTNYTVPWWTVDGGGGTSNSETLAVSGTAGQPDAGEMGGGKYVVSGGFWGNAEASKGIQYAAYLPAVMNNSVHVTYFVGPLESEPNNSYLEANGALYSGRAYYGFPDDTKDYFSIYLQTGGKITIDLTNHVGVGVQLHLFYQSVSNRVRYILSPPYRIDYTGPAGWYYIYIYTASGYTSTSQYTLRATYP